MSHNTIYNGTKLVLLTVSQIKIIDSHNFVASPLSAFPKTFGLNELKKGVFPPIILIQTKTKIMEAPFPF
jgi:hypothetical protein